ncbi:PQQ-dependent sugar dehydrogenase [Myxococcus sp. CA051A]|uniref:PQQ-dependent sugar dehydrogenase n=1 Tax=unclassified Myxococcus TaxID=2648731 RepID=UPI00157BAE70|nr:MULTISPECIES: PQQ-dependent sugar dehydrogenase [unclassified Myxococcus]NTX50866.1 PQQ-dependent sugar dehydrogenase [Myxococcus sp. CA039A]NTX62915.1 PQQ-dependent sugar dehydrogenase [Myxococcus sp. CA051A]
MHVRRLPLAAHRAVLALLFATAIACGVKTENDPELSTQSAAVTSGTRLIGVQSGRCLDVSQNSQTSGQGLNIYDCHAQANQRFLFTPEGELRVFDGAWCVQPATASAGGRAVISACTGAANQRWVRNTSGAVVHTATSLCLDVSGQATANSSPVVVWNCNGQTNQQWSLPVDTQPPTVPTGLTLSNVTCNSATLTWSPSTDNEGVAFYDVYHDGQHMKAVSGAVVSTGLTVVPGATWGLYVNARDAAGNVSQGSATLTITPPQCQVDTQAPSIPTGVTATALGTSVTVSWTASTDNVGVSAYDVFRGGVKIGTVSGSPPGTTFVDSGLSPSTTYAYAVLARDAQANASAQSSTATVTTGQACTNDVCSVSQVATDTDIPWGLVNLPDGSVLYGRRDAQNIVRLDPATGQKTSVGVVPNVQSTDGEGGLMGLALSPTFSTDRWLYVMHTSPTDNRIVRLKYENGALNTSSLQVLLSGIGRNKFHNGGRLRFGPDGKLYASTGDAQNGAYAQDLNNLAGKVLRLNADGTLPSDNPFGNFVWSYGHRNPQGLAFDSQGRLWEQEFGNSVMDETNLIQRGGNYGWPNCEGTVSQGGSGCATAGYIAPKRTYSTAEGSCSGIAVVRDVLYVACARGSRLYREVISGTELTNVQQFFVGTYGRLRTVEPTPDGNLWMTTTNQGDKDSIPDNSNEKIFRVVLGQ